MGGQEDSVPDLDKQRSQAIPLVRPLPTPLLHDWRQMEVCLINLNKGEDDKGCLKFCNILKWSATCGRKITEGLFRKYSTLGQNKCESPITMLKTLYTLTGGPLNFEALGFSLSSLQRNLELRGEGGTTVVRLKHMFLKKRVHDKAAISNFCINEGCHGHYHIVVGFITTYAIGDYLQ